MKRILIAACLAASLAGCGIQYSDGTRVGTVQKISHKGFIFKTYEGELVMDGMRFRQGGAGTNIWRFSVQDPKVVEQIEQASEAGSRVKLTYNQVAFPPVWRGSTGYYITKVEVLTGKQ